MARDLGSTGHQHSSLHCSMGSGTSQWRNGEHFGPPAKIKEQSDVQSPIQDGKPRETSPETWKSRYCSLMSRHEEKIIKTLHCIIRKIHVP
ncbi:hypothetical protein TNCV_2010931 [Trichonephila clavipes]|nr:hypothetical protein TNCV_2010931 [Trichonephila clavipes]